MAEGGIAVVGGGLAGLSAAIALQSLGHDVDLYERSRLLGGKVTSFSVDGVEVDNGQHVFLACCHAFIDFVGSLQLMGPDSSDDGPLTLQPHFQACLLRRGRPPVRLSIPSHPRSSSRLPLHLLPALIAARHLGAGERLALALAMLQVRAAPYPSETFASWLRRHRQGHAAIEGFWEPFVVPALNGPLDQVAAQDALFVIRTAFLEDPRAARFGYSKVPLGRIAEAAASRLDSVHCRRAVYGVGLENRSGALTLRGLRLREGRLRPYEGVVLAIPPQRLKALLERPKDLGIYGLDQFRMAAIVDVHLWFDLPAGTVFGSELGFGALLGSPVQWIFEKAAPIGETYLCCSMSAADRYVAWQAERLTGLCLDELKAALPTLRRARLLRSAVTRDREATFVPTVGLIRPSASTASPRVVLAGAWTDTGWPATMESAVLSGRNAAKLLHENLAG